MKIIQTTQVKLASDFKIQPTLDIDSVKKPQSSYLTDDNAPDGPDDIKKRFTDKKKTKKKKRKKYNLDE